MQIKYEWCSVFSRDNFKHKFYIATYNLWEEALPSL
jgi:hypothetical protein